MSTNGPTGNVVLTSPTSLFFLLRRHFVWRTIWQQQHQDMIALHPYNWWWIITDRNPKECLFQGFRGWETYIFSYCLCISIVCVCVPAHPGWGVGSEDIRDGHPSAVSLPHIHGPPAQHRRSGAGVSVRSLKMMWCRAGCELQVSHLHLCSAGLTLPIQTSMTINWIRWTLTTFPMW